MQSKGKKKRARKEALAHSLRVLRSRLRRAIKVWEDGPPTVLLKRACPEPQRGGHWLSGAPRQLSRGASGVGRAPRSGRQGAPVRALLSPRRRPRPAARRHARRRPRASHPRACAPPALRAPPLARRGTSNGYEALSRVRFLLSHCLPGKSSLISAAATRVVAAEAAATVRAGASVPLSGTASPSPPGLLGPERTPGCGRAVSAASRSPLGPGDTAAPCEAAVCPPALPLRPRRCPVPSGGSCHGHRQPRGRGAPGAGEHPAPADREPAQLGSPAEKVPVHAQRGGEQDGG